MMQEQIIRLVPGLENAKILRHGYAVEYDMVWPTQIRSTLETKAIQGAFPRAAKSNGTSGYEAAAVVVPRQPASTRPNRPLAV